ncbi:MAG: hypothetical protein E7005_01675 [Alphaproteobacteria bacterium]|nr:hypothetical protein [Alphaproteobacteria bacterium]
MKKVIVILAILVASCTTLKKDKFVNPIFYKTMHPISKMVGETQITPTSYRSDYNGYITTGNCILLENEQNYIKLKCEILYSGETELQTKIIKYELSTDVSPYLYNENEQRIKETIHADDTSEKFFAKFTLYVDLLE